MITEGVGHNLTPSHHNPQFMRCLKDYIGIEGCTTPTPESGLYVNRLQGVTIEGIDKLANPEQKTFLNVWRDVQDRGLRTFSTEVTNYFRTKYKLKQLVDRFDFGTLTRTTEPPVLAEWRGIKIELSPNTTSPELSSLLSIVLSDIEYYAHVNQSIRFVVADSVIGTVYFDETIAVTGNSWNRIIPKLSTPVNQIPRTLTIAFYADTVTSIETTIDDEIGGTGGCGCDTVCSECCDAEVRGFTYDAINSVYTHTPNNAHGFRGFISLQCSFEGLVCVNRDLFASALWYLLGAELMNERMFSDRINKYTTIDKKKASELFDVFDARWRHELSLVIDGIDLNDYGCCLECNPVVSFQYSQL